MIGRKIKLNCLVFLKFANWNYLNLCMDKSFLRIAFADDDMDDHLFFFDAVKRTYQLALINNFFNSEDLLNFFVVQKNIPPHIIFLDKNMPGNENYECLVEIKKTPVLSTIPVIIYSTSSHLPEIEAGLRKGATAFITKPGDMAETIQVLRETINEFVPVDFHEKMRSAVWGWWKADWLKRQRLKFEPDYPLTNFS